MADYAGHVVDGHTQGQRPNPSLRPGEIRQFFAVALRAGVEASYRTSRTHGLILVIGVFVAIQRSMYWMNDRLSTWFTA